MTEKIYYRDAYAQANPVSVVATGTDENGDYAVLDQSCFYPEGGGQPADTGTIGDIEVMDVQTVGGEVRHYTTRTLDKGDYIATIDWERRYDHMQQHTGQHLLSAVFENEFGMATKSFHMGEERVTVDLDVPSIQPDQLKRVEQQVNNFIRRKISVETEWVTQEQAAGMELRKTPAVEGDVRLVKIGDIDLNACGGTHLANTAELGLVKIIRTEKAKSATRVYFLCGDRAMRHFDLLQSVTDQLTRSLNAPVAELPDAAAALVADRKEKEKQLKKLNLRLLEAEADNMLPENNMLIEIFEERTIKEVQQLAQLKTQKHKELYILFMIREGAELHFVCAKSKNAPGDMKSILAKLTGGNEDGIRGAQNIAQASASINDEPEFYENAFQNLINKIT